MFEVIAGGKAFGEYMAKWEKSLDDINQEFLDDEHYNEDEELPQKLQEYKNIMDVKYMLEKLGQPKTHLELKKMIKEVDSTNTEAINYKDFCLMMLAFAKPKEKPTGVPPKRDLASLP
nr:hypothetical protein BaRGS_004802 [Batillaria attramentaria]